MQNDGEKFVEVEQPSPSSTSITMTIPHPSSAISKYANDNSTTCRCRSESPSKCSAHFSPSTTTTTTTTTLVDSNSLESKCTSTANNINNNNNNNHSNCKSRSNSFQNNINNNIDIEDDKCRRLYDFDDAPIYLRFNPFIRKGYRGILSTQLCLESVFWWTNETINIWSHVFGFLLFFGLTIYDLILLNIHASFGDKFIVAVLLCCFQACMILSSMYHTFSCRSEDDYHCFLSFDLFGIALSLLAIYMSGIYYAFWCHRELQVFYVITVTVIFIVAMLLQVPKFNVDSNVKMLVFVGWAAYGVIPTVHWAIAMGGMANPMVATLLPRVLGMYLISGTAFLIYLTKVPERWLVGKVDFLGHSHQWWHFFVLVALYYWHNTGMMYVEYRMNHACSENLRLP